MLAYKIDPNEDESVFEIVQRLVIPISVIAEMMQVGDADQKRHYELAKLLLASLINLGEGISQSFIDADDSLITREKFATEVSHVIYSLQDLLLAEATALYGRKANAESMDTYSDTNATAIFITQNQLAYGCNHEPTVRAFNDKVNLDVVTKAAKNQNEIRVRELIKALYDGIENRGDY